MTYCTWYYIYTGCYTSLYLQNFHFTARPQRGLAREAQESENDKREKEKERKKERHSRKRRKREQHPTCQPTQIHPFLSLSAWQYRLILRVFRVRIFNTDTRESKSFYWEKSLSEWGLRRVTREKTLWILIRGGTLRRRDLLGDTRRPRVRQNLSRVHYGSRTNHESSRLTDDKMPVLLRGRPAGRRLINDDKRDENGFDLSGERERD